jgi:hypothetical protein
MSRMTISIIKAKPAVVGLLIWLFMTPFLFSLSSITPWFIDSNDPYYHHAHAESYMSGSMFHMPVFSSYTNQTDLYFLYHVLLAPLTAISVDEEPFQMILATKLLHAATASLIFVAVFFITRSLLHQTHIRSVYQKANIYALLATWLTFAVSSQFDFRLLAERPHLFSILFTLLAYFGYIARRPLILLPAAILTPLFYSVSVILFIPILTDFFIRVLYHRSLKAVQGYLYTLTLPMLGVGMGIWLHPASQDYVNNGIVAHLSILTRNIFQGRFAAAETSAATMRADVLIWIVPLAIALAWVLYKILKSRNVQAVPITSLTLLSIALVFTILHTQVARAIEYTIPFVAIALVYVYVTEIIPEVRLFLRSKIPAQSSPLQVASHELGRTLAVRAQKYMIILLVAYSLTTVVTLGLAARVSDDAVRYKYASEYIKTNYPPGTLIFNPQFHTYARMSFYAPNYLYAHGMGYSTLYAHNPELAEAIYNFVSVGQRCTNPESICSSETAIPDLMRDVYHTNIVLVDGSHSTPYFGSDSDRTFVHPLIAYFSQHPDFSLKFLDPDMEMLHIFELTK